MQSVTTHWPHICSKQPLPQQQQQQQWPQQQQQQQQWPQQQWPQQLWPQQQRAALQTKAWAVRLEVHACKDTTSCAQYFTVCCRESQCSSQNVCERRWFANH